MQTAQVIFGAGGGPYALATGASWPPNAVARAVTTAAAAEAIMAPVAAVLAWEIRISSSTVRAGGGAKRLSKLPSTAFGAMTAVSGRGRCRRPSASWSGAPSPGASGRFFCGCSATAGAAAASSSPSSSSSSGSEPSAKASIARSPARAAGDFELIFALLSAGFVFFVLFAAAWARLLCRVWRH